MSATTSFKYNKGGRKVKDLYADLLEVIEPYLSDFTGYDEKEQGFNIVLAVKELLSEFNIENVRLNSCLQEIKEIAETCYDPADKENDGFYTILQLITKAEEE